MPVLLLAVLLAVASGVARAGGPFERVIGVGGHGRWGVIELAPTGPRSDRSLFRDRPRARAPRAGYVRLFPILGGLPGIPGRFYPRGHILCLGWHEPAVDCRRLPAEGMRLLSPFARLPLRTALPTVVTAVRHDSGLPRYADGNVFAALELALDRRATCCARAPAAAVSLAVAWRGPTASIRPHRVRLGPRGVYVRRRLYPLPTGVWRYVVANLP